MPAGFPILQSRCYPKRYPSRFAAVFLSAAKAKMTIFLRALTNIYRIKKHVLIDDVLTDRLAVERAQDIACGLLAHPIHCFPSHSCDMRRHDDIRKLKQRMTGRRRLLLENIEARTRELAREQRVIQRRLGCNSAAAGVD